jgi:shikimate kinase
MRLDRANIVLTGFMGTGKTTVGRLLARELGLRFLDLDSVIEEREGSPVSAIFNERGEGHFRRAEAAVIEDVASGARGDGLVLATGGGAVVNPASRAGLRAWGVVVCLKATMDEIIRRTRATEGSRPLLSGPEPGAASRLLAEREEAYLDCDLVLDTTGVSPAESVERIKGFLKARVRGKAGG